MSHLSPESLPPVRSVSPSSKSRTCGVLCGLFLLPWVLPAADRAAQLILTDEASTVLVSGASSSLGSWPVSAMRLPRAVQVKGISSGITHSQVIKSDGSLIGWGSNYMGETTPPADLGPVSSVSAGAGFTMAVTSSGSLRCWGSKLPVPLMANVSSVSAGVDHGLALKNDGTVVAWGNNSGGQSNVPAGLSNVIAVAAGYLHSLALRADGTVVAWGDNRLGQCNIPGDVVNAVAIAAGQWHSAALLADGSVRFWQNYVRHPTGSSLPAPESLRDVVAITAGGYSVMALRRGGSVVAWGWNEAAEKPATLGKAVSVSAGYVRAMALHGDGSVTNWDNPDYLPLWPRMPENLAPPASGPDQESVHLGYLENRGAEVLSDITAVIEGPDADQFSVLLTQVNNIAIGGKSAFAVRCHPSRTGPLTAELKIHSNALGSPFVLPLISGGTYPIPDLLVSDETGAAVTSGALSTLGGWPVSAPKAARAVQVKGIVSGNSHSLTIKADGSIVGWGYNISGQAAPPADLGPVSSVAAGNNFSLALTDAGTLRGWGSSSGGRLPPPPLVNVVSVSTSGLHALGLTRNGTVTAWGDNSSGQCNVPAGLSNVIAIAAGNLHSLALRADGTVVAWGNNQSGQCNVPADVVNAVAIAAGQWHSAALLADGSVRYWQGYMSNWSIGSNPTPQSLRDVVAITAGGYSVMALRRGGSVVAWGGYEAGLIPQTLGKAVSVAAGYTQAMALHGDGSVTNWEDPAYNFWSSMPAELAPPATGPDQAYTHLAYLENRGTSVITDIRAVIEGPDADQFSVLMTQVNNLAIGGKSAFAIRYHPTRGGELKADLKIYSSAAGSPFVMPLRGAGNFSLTAIKDGSAPGNFTYGPLRLDRQTGLMLQQIRFTNTLDVSVYGLRLFLSRIAAGVVVYSSSATKVKGTLEVEYAKEVARGESITFDLVYYDPKRRTADAIVPTIRTEALLEPVQPEPLVKGKAVPLTRIVLTAQGPLLEWKSKKGALYIVEYTDDGVTWQSAVHVLKATTAKTLWVDRGQPETRSKPVILPGGTQAHRQYAVRQK